ncbi:spermidine synthase [Actinokineospora guangxiensis]|uniref:Spermidine synthase n=1 Tax=Actinokineospora guangxiensis TaxID=1490288 RepID=A0ABW0ETI1_9PSEU
MDEPPTVIARATGAAGELVLRRSGEHHEIIADGMFLMDTRAGDSERLLVNAAADRMPAGASLVVGGLGVGYSLAAALANPRVGEVVVVEREPAVIDWNRSYLGNSTLLDDPRTRCVEADLVAWLSTVEEKFGAICLDIDNGPEWTLDGNAGLYGERGLHALAGRTGVLSVWSANATPAFATRLRTHFAEVTELPVPVPRGEPDVVYLASRPSPSRPS